MGYKNKKTRVSRWLTGKPRGYRIGKYAIIPHDGLVRNSIRGLKM